MQHSDSSKRSPAVAMLATHLPFLDVRLVNNLVTSRIASQSQRFPEVKDRQEQLVPVFHVTSRHDHQRIPLTFRDSQLPVAITREQARHALRCQSTTHKEQEKDSTALRYHDCRVSALCPVRDSVPDACEWAVQHMMDVSPHCRCQV